MKRQQPEKRFTNRKRVNVKGTRKEPEGTQKQSENCDTGEKTKAPTNGR